MYNRKFCHFSFVAATFLFAISLVFYIIKKHRARELVDNPGIKIEATNTNENIDFMINRALREGAKAQQGFFP